MNGRILYLQVGDHVYHKKYSQWGMGEVVKKWHSTLPAGGDPGQRATSGLVRGPSFVKVEFQDRKMRVFDNDFKSVSCCYYSGLIQIGAGD
jgi:hypothetical protein